MTMVDDLAGELAALGLPTAFCAGAKTPVSSRKSRKKKETILGYDANYDANEIHFPEFCTTSVRLYTSAICSFCHRPMQGKADPDDPSDLLDRQLSDYISEYTQNCLHFEDEVAESIDGLLEGHSGFDSNETAEGGTEWQAIWDEEFQRHYFFNAETLESTWDVPSGFEYHSNAFGVHEESPFHDAVNPDIENDLSATIFQAAVITEKFEVLSCPTSAPEHLEVVGDREELSTMKLRGSNDARVGEPDCHQLNNGVSEKVKLNIPILSSSRGTHVRFCYDDSDDGELGEDGGVNWNEIETKKTQFSREGLERFKISTSSSKAKCETMWQSVWDEQRQRQFFVNTETQESTWDVPSNFQHHSDASVSPESNFLPDIVCPRKCENLKMEGKEMHGDNKAAPCGKAEQEALLEEAMEGVLEEAIEGLEASSSLNRVCSSCKSIRVNESSKHMPLVPKKRRLMACSFTSRSPAVHNSSSDMILLPGMSKKMHKQVLKYWIQRYSLFSKYDLGIRMDYEGWFSVTPEVIAKHQANRCGNGLVVDGFTGVGGNAIQFALRNNNVIAIDISPERIECARHNAAIYGVSDKIEFIVGDFFQLAPSLKADVVFLSPPWGGPEYAKEEIYDIRTMLQPKDGFTLLKTALAIAPSISIFLPRNVDVNQLQELSWQTSPPLPCEVEYSYTNDKLKAVTAYFGDIVNSDLSEGCSQQLKPLETMLKT